jgi:hypothetical protein
MNQLAYGAARFFMQVSQKRKYRNCQYVTGDPVDQERKRSDQEQLLVDRVHRHVR